MINKATGPSAAEEKKWRAEVDLRTLIDAEKIKKDKPRYAAALKAKKAMADELAAVGKESK
jgi:hypothetical protein